MSTHMLTSFQSSPVTSSLGPHHAAAASPLPSPPSSSPSAGYAFFTPPKRKRPLLEIPETPRRLDAAADDEESYSPRTRKLVGSFGELQLDSRAVVSPAAAAAEPPPLRKRVRHVQTPPEEDVQEKPDQPLQPAQPLPEEKKTGFELPREDEGIELQASPTKERRRLKSPPLQRASFVHEEDEGLALEDDDEDIHDENGIGFKPTPTQRMVRDQKRMQQIKEYKIRESRDAREKRMRERGWRRTSVGGRPMGAGHDSRKKAVHFSF